jgi:endonuclease/exonuclease/phosphatase (EEP) superfamily protein YafD
MICTLINLSAIAPFYRPNRTRPDNEIIRRRLKLAFANVERCNTAYDSFIALITRQEPDVVIVQEVDKFWAISLQTLHTKYPFNEVMPRGGGSGIALYSRFSFERLPISLPEGDARPGLMAKLDIEGSAVSLLTIHTRAPLRRGHFERRNKALAAAAGFLKHLPSPKVFAGDLNITPWSTYYQSFIKETKMINVRKGFGLLASWPTFMLFGWLMIPIDHCLVSEDIIVLNAKSGERIGSDHLPLIVEMEIPLTRRPSQH